jgi:hypothetical protein
MKDVLANFGLAQFSYSIVHGIGDKRPRHGPGREPMTHESANTIINVCVFVNVINMVKYKDLF